MELRHLRYFVVVAEELNFSRAAERLMMAQPPLSQQIKILENEIGFQLFNRTKRKVELTNAGVYFLEKAYDILNLVKTSCDETQQIHLGKMGQLILGFTGSVIFDLLPRLLRKYQEKYPNIKIKLRQLATSEQVKALHEGRIHVGLLVPPVESVSLNLKKLREEPFIVALPKTHSLARYGSPIDLSLLANEPFIMTNRDVGPSFYDAITSLCYHAGFNPIKSQEAHELHTIVALVASGMGAAILPQSIKHFKNKDVIYLSLKESYTTCITSLAWDKENDSPVVQSFIRLVDEAIIPNL